MKHSFVLAQYLEERMMSAPDKDLKGIRKAAYDLEGSQLQIADRIRCFLIFLHQLLGTTLKLDRLT